jgi:zinc/manganese transport system permease protein
MRVTASPRLVPLLSALFGFVAVVGGILLALGGTVPISPYVTTLSFAIYVICRIIGWRRAKAGRLAG